MPIDRDELGRRLLATFREELEDHVEVLERALVALERDPRGPDAGDWLRALFREAHTLKGAARAVNLSPIERACHRMEEAFAAAQAPGAAVGASGFAYLFRVVDALREAGRVLAAGGTDLAGSPIQALADLAPPTPRRALADEPGAPEPRAKGVSEEGEGLGRGAGPPQRPPHPAVHDTPAREGRVQAGDHAPTEGAPASTTTEDRGRCGGPGPPPQEPEAAPVTPAPSAAPPAPPASAAVPPGASRDADIAVRVPARKLDALLVHGGELALARRRGAARRAEAVAVHADATALVLEVRRLQDALERVPEGARARDVLARVRNTAAGLDAALGRLADGMAADDRAVDLAARPVHEAVRALRMLPLAQAVSGLDRAARDLAAADGKEVEVRVEGAAIELDRTILEAVREALLHLVRNAVAHGIEPPEVRRAIGKPARGTVEVEAALRGGSVEISVRDDGRGIDADAVRARARALGVPPPTDARATLRLLFRPGFTTAAHVTSAAGRGVGLDIVQERMAAIHGSVDATSTPGAGATFLLTVPLTLTALRVVLAEAGGAVCCLPGRSVGAVARVDRTAIVALGGRHVVNVGGETIALGSLATIVGARPAPAQEPRMTVVVVESGGQRVALAVDGLLSEQEVVVRSLGRRLHRVPGVAGATILPDGRVALLLHPPDVVDAVLGGAATAPAHAVAPTPRARRVLVVDDSVTTRTLVRLILEGAGCEVRTAADGEEAWAALREEAVDVVVSDVQMPRADGIELTRRIRASTRLSGLPVVLLTGLGSDDDRARGLEAGASAYLVKEGFAAEALIEAVQRRS